MLDEEYNCLLRFVKAVYKAGVGTDEDAYLRLLHLSQVMHECSDHAERSHLIDGIIDHIETTVDGMFYLPEDE